MQLTGTGQILTSSCRDSASFFSRVTEIPGSITLLVVRKIDILMDQAYSFCIEEASKQKPKIQGYAEKCPIFDVECVVLQYPTVHPSYPRAAQKHKEANLEVKMRSIGRFK